MTQTPPQYACPPLSPTALDERAAQIAERHAERMDGLERAGRAQQALKEGLQQAMDDEQHELGVLDKLIALFVEQPHAPLLETLSRHHEVAVERVRALGHHIEALDSDLGLVQRDIRALNKEMLDARSDAELARFAHQRAEVAFVAMQARRLAQDTPELRAEIDEIEAWRWERATDERRFSCTVDRLQGLLELNRELRRVMRQLHASLTRLHEAGAHTLQGMSRHVSTLRVAASARDLAEETATAFEELRGSVLQACHLADENVTYLAEHVDDLEQRMRILDSEAAARNEAEREVALALEKARQWQA